MTERPYSDDDLRAEAVRQHATLTEDPDYVGVGERMEDAEVGSLAPRQTATDIDGQPNDADGVTWSELLDPEQDGSATYDEAQQKIHDLISGAAEVSQWAIDLGADGLEPSPDALNLDGDDGPFVRIHFAFDSDMSDLDRYRFQLGLAQVIADAF